MSTSGRIVRILLILPLLAGLAWGQFALKDGDRVVFYGDSITDQRLYSTFAETFVVTRFPALKVGFVHSGWGGDRVTGGGGGRIDLRLERDVFAYKPTVMTIMLGMNDGRYRAFDDEIFATYANGYRQIIESVKRALPGIRITVIQPSPYDDVTRAPTFPGGYNAVLVRYGRFLAELAEKESLQVADLNTPVVADLEKANAADPALAVKIVPDRVHPGPGGHLIMAGALLKSWKAPALVTAVEIDGTARKAVREENTKVTGLVFEGGISWEQDDAALPMPIDLQDPVISLAVRSSDFVDTLDRQPLKITGLAAGRYGLWIDGEKIGTFSPEELSEGVNLAVLPTPMAKRAAAVHALTLKHNNIHFARWRSVQVPLENDRPAKTATALEALDALENELIQRQRDTAQSRPHRYELKAE